MPARFVPQLHIPSGTFELDFYLKAFDASLLRSWKNEDGTYHVAEMEIDGAMFHFHEDKPAVGHLTPAGAHGVTTIIGLMVDDVDRIMEQARQCGARIISPAQDYDYGFRQGQFKDLLGHVWMIEKSIPISS
jgi:PhnB protein